MNEDIIIKQLKTFSKFKNFEKFCPIPLELIRNDFTDTFDKKHGSFIYVLPVLMSLKANYNEFNENGIISIEYIVKENGMKTPVHSKVKQQIMYALNELQKAKLVKIDGNINNLKLTTLFTYQLSDLLRYPYDHDNIEFEIDKNKYVKLSYCDYYYMLKQLSDDMINVIFNKILILLHLKSYMSEINIREQSYFCSYESIAYAIGLNKKTISKYTDEMANENKLIIKKQIGRKQHKISKTITEYPSIYTLTSFKNIYKIMEVGVDEMIKIFHKNNEFFYNENDDNNDNTINILKIGMKKLQKQKGAYIKNNNNEKVLEIDNNINFIKNIIQNIVQKDIAFLDDNLELDYIYCEQFDEINYEFLAGHNLNIKVKK